LQRDGKEEAIGSVNQESNANAAPENAKDNERIVTVVNNMRRSGRKEKARNSNANRAIHQMVVQGQQI